MTLRMKLEENRPYQIMYSQGKSAFLDIPDAMSRLIMPSWDAMLDDEERENVTDGATPRPSDSLSFPPHHINMLDPQAGMGMTG